MRAVLFEWGAVSDFAVAMSASVFAGRDAKALLENTAKMCAAFKTACICDGKGALVAFRQELLSLMQSKRENILLGR